MRRISRAPITKRSWYGARKKVWRSGLTTEKKTWQAWKISSPCAVHAAGGKSCRAASPHADAIRADLLHEAGAHAIQELGYAIAAGVERPGGTAARHEPVDAAAREIEFVFAVGPSYFMEIAKLRAARLLWAQAVAAFGANDAESCAMQLHVRTPRRNKSICDRYTNLLRVTTEALSAVIGGCDQLTIEPFGFDEHLALNIQRILQEESHLDAVADPAGGSYYIETLTDSIARAAWKLFQQVEAEGGYTKALASGSIEKALAATARRARQSACPAAAATRWRKQLSQPDGKEVRKPRHLPPNRTVRFLNTGSRSRLKRSGSAPSTMRASPDAIRKCCCSRTATSR